MSLRDAARQAWLDGQQSSEVEARLALVELFGDQALVDGLTTLQVEVGEGFVRWFFEDSEGLKLRVSRRSSDGEWTANLVEEESPGVWLDLGEVPSLKKLWEILPETEAEVQGWVAGEEVVPGDLRSYESIDYECIQGHTTQAGWEPPNAPALWTVVS